MDANTTVAVDILIRTSLGNAGASFDRELARMEASARAWAKRMNDIFAKINTNFTPPGTNFGGRAGGSGRGTSGGGGGDPAMAAAMRDITRYQNERKRMDAEYTRHVNQQAEKQYQTQVRRIQRENEYATRAFQNTIKSNQAALQSASQNTGITAGGIWSASFWGNLAGNIVSNFTSRLAQLPGMLKQILDEAIKIAQQRELALAGLTSVAAAKGINTRDTAEAVKNLRLVKAGIVDVGNATTAMKNLLATNFNLAEATKLLEAFSDTAAFGKQNALSFGEAIRGASEGIKNGNSILVDNVGLTKNLSIILKEMGFAETDLMRVQSDLNVRTALYTGLLKEAAVNAGDADRITQTYTGSQAALNMAYENFLATIGDIIIKNPALIAMMRTLTEDINKQNTALKSADSTWRDTIGSWTTSFAQFVINFRAGISSEIADLKELGNYIELTGARLGKLMSLSIDWFDVSGMAKYYDTIINDKYSKVGTFSAGAESERKALQQSFDRNTVIQMGVKPGYNPLTQNYRAPLGSSLNRPKMSDLIDLSVKPNNGMSTGTDAGSTKGSRKNNFVPGRDATALLNAAEILGISPIDLATIIGYETRGTFSTGIVGGKGNNYQGLIQFGPEERRRYGVSGKQSFEEQILNSVVPFLQDRFGSVGRSTAGASILDLYKTINGGNPNVSSGASDGNGTIASHVQRMLRQNRGAAISRFFGGDESNIPSVSKSDKEFAEIAFWERLRSQGPKILDLTRSGGNRGGGPLSTDGSGVTAEVTTRTEGYVAALRESLGLNTRIEQLALRQTALQGEITARVQDYVIALEEARTTNESDLAVAKSRLPLVEAEIAFGETRVRQVNQARDIERDIATFRMQQSDAAFVAQRALLASKREQLGLEQDIADAQDALNYQGVNDALRVRASLLKDIYDLRERETDAIIAANRAQLEITQQTQYSAAQANAKVLEFMANQKGVTDIMADFRIGLVESGYDLIDAGLDKIIPKIGVLGGVIKDMLSSFLKLAVNAAFRRLFGLDNGQNGSGGGRSGGGIGGFFGNLFSGGGGGFTSTPGFNPNAGGVGSNAGGGFLSSIMRMFGGGGGATGSSLGISGAVGAAAGGAVGTGGGGVLGGALGQAAQRSGGGGISAALQGQLMGALTGGALGASLGQGDPFASVLGAGAGVIGGTLASGLLSGAFTGSTGGGIFGATPGLFGLSGAATFGIGLAVAGGIALISYLFGRAARRRKEKREVTRLSGEALQKVQQLVADVNAFKLDGATAYQQGIAIRDDYQEQIKALKTKPGKALAAQKLAEINRLLGDLKTAGDRSDRLRNIASVTDEQLVPTFAVGGFTGMRYGAQLAVLHSHEAVLRQQDIMALGGYRALQNAGVRGMGIPENTDRSYSVKNSGGGSGNGQPIYVVGVFDEETADDMFDKVSHYGVAKKVRFAAKKDLAGMVTQIENTMAGEG